MSLLRHLQGQRYFAGIGDSKSVTPCAAWQWPLITYLEGYTNCNWGVGFNHASAGWKAADAFAGLAAALATATLKPKFICVDLGINDVNAGTSQASFETAYSSILDQLHIKWPNTPIWVARIHRTGAEYTSAIANVNSYIDNVLASRGWSAVAFDEADWLGSLSTDGVHPNPAGYFEMARRWFAALR